MELEKKPRTDVRVRLSLKVVEDDDNVIVFEDYGIGLKIKYFKSDAEGYMTFEGYNFFKDDLRYKFKFHYKTWHHEAPALVEELAQNVIASRTKMLEAHKEYHEEIINCGIADSEESLVQHIADLDGINHDLDLSYHRWNTGDPEVAKILDKGERMLNNGDEKEPETSSTE